MQLGVGIPGISAAIGDSMLAFNLAITILLGQGFNPMAQIIKCITIVYLNSLCIQKHTAMLLLKLKHVDFLS
jgi:hypothetical protein